MKITNDMQERSTKILTNDSPARHKKRETPWMDGNGHAVKHGTYRRGLSPEEVTEREAYEADLIDDLGCATTAMRTLIRRASWLEIRLRRMERASGEIADEHALAWINSQRLLLCALGLEKRQAPGTTLAQYLEQRKAEAAEGESLQ